MKFLLDVCASSRRLLEALAEAGHDARSAAVGHSSASDEELLALAHEERRVLITEDKDFGELVFLRGRRHPCVIRLVELDVGGAVNAVRHLIDQHGDVLRSNALVVVTKRRVRIRRSGIGDEQDG